MAIYEALAPVYDAFFPPNPKATAFILRLAGEGGPTRRADPRGGTAPKRGRAVLDLGSATGSQVFDLAAAGFYATGYEPCLPMLGAAKDKARALGLEGTTRFEALGMLDAIGREAKEGFDLILCLGNTLPYLDSRDDLEGFLGGIEALLVPGGALVLQLLNYSRVLAALEAGGFAFPDLEARGLRFRRHYEGRADGRLDFVTRLESVTGRGTAPEGATAPLLGEGRDALLPVRPGELALALGEAGFRDLAIHPGWEGGSFDEGRDGYLVTVARRG